MILNHGVLVVDACWGKADIVRVLVERAVILYADFAGYIPARKAIRIFKGTVCHHFGIETTVGSKVDVLEENAIHSALDSSTRLFCLDNHFVTLGKRAETAEHGE